MIKQEKTISLNKGINRITFSPVSEGIIIESIYPYIEGCQFLEQKFSPPSTLIWKVSSDLEGEANLELAYLTRGVDWQVNYQVLIDAEEKNLFLSSSLTVENKKGASWWDVDLNFIRSIKFEQLKERVYLEESPAETTGFGHSQIKYEFNVTVRKDKEHIIYHLNTPIDLLKTDIKTFPLFSISDIPGKKVYLFDGEKYGDEVREEISFRNPLDEASDFFFPEGNLYIYKNTPDGKRIYLGSRKLNQLPPGGKARIYLGPARGITGYRIQTFYREMELTPVEKKAYEKNMAREYGYRLIFSNMRSYPVTIKVIEHFYGLWKILESEPQNYEKTKEEIIYYLEVPANSYRVINYRAKII